MQKFAHLNSQMYQQVMQGYDENKNNELEIEEWFTALRHGAIPGPGQAARQGKRPMPGQQPPRPGRPGMQGQQGIYEGVRPGFPMRPGQVDPSGTPSRPRQPQVPQTPMGQQPRPPQPLEDDGGLLDGIDLEDDSETDEDLNLDFLNF